MCAAHCCHSEPASSRIASPSNAHTLFRSTSAVGKWLVPTALLVLMPKCPICFAGYIALGTGLGISLTAAAWLRTGLIAVCIAALIYLLANGLRRLHRKFSNQAQTN